MPQRRNFSDSDSLQTSRETILAAATIEIAQKGLAGLRMEHVARRSGYNKALVYRHFKNRDFLFRAVLHRQISRRIGALEQLPEDFSDMLKRWSVATLKDKDFVALLMREALDQTDAMPALAEARRGQYERQINAIKTLQDRKRIKRDFDPNYLLLALMAIVSVPAMLPQVCELVTGKHPDDPDFQDKFSVFLDQFTKSLR